MEKSAHYLDILCRKVDMALSERDRKILLAVHRGKTNMEIGKEFGLSDQTICNIKHKPDFKIALASAENGVKKYFERQITARLNASDVIAEAMDILVSEVPNAIKTLVRLSKSGELSERLQYDASLQILDRAGVKAQERTVERSYSVEEITSANSVLKETVTITERLTNLPSKYVLRSMADQNAGKSPDTEHDSNGTSKNRQETVST